MNPQQPSPPASAKDQVAEQLRKSANVLVTVSNNPSIDQLATAIGTTLVLNKLGKHATAVFSGQPPSIIEFLQPEKTFEKTTDSLRDFIIALDKSKADKLRYKVEDKFVKIFITPYHTNLSEKDLEFSQGDYNIDVVLALGVKKKDELDQAIVAHGRILHDAAIISVNIQPGADVGSVNLNVPAASSLSEIMVSIIENLKDEQKPLYDQQIATAYLTGIVAETQRFSNSKTTPQTMNIAAKLMNAGANQQLIATKLEAPKPTPEGQTQNPAKQSLSKPTVKPAQTTDGAITIDHESSPELKLPHPEGGIEDEGQNQEEVPQDTIQIDNQGKLHRLDDSDPNGSGPLPPSAISADSRKVVDTPPKLSGRLSANTEQEKLDPSSDPLSQTSSTQPILNRDMPKVTPISPLPTTSGATTEHPVDDKTLSDIESSVKSPHLDPKIGEVKPGGKAELNYPSQLVGQDQGLGPDQSGTTVEPGAPPPIPPPLPMPPSSNLNDPNSGVPL